MKLDQVRSGVYALTVSAHEPSTVLADARGALAGVLGDLDAALGKLKRPSA